MVYLERFYSLYAASSSTTAAPRLGKLQNPPLNPTTCFGKNNALNSAFSAMAANGDYVSALETSAPLRHIPQPYSRFGI